MKKLVIIAIAYSFAISCTDHNRIISNPDGLFSKNELAELGQIVKGFDKILKREYATKTAKEAYFIYSYESWKSLQESSSIKYIEDIEEFYFVINDKEVIDEIWKLDSMNSIKYLRNRGKYFKYLEYIGKRYPIIEQYQKKISETGDITPSLIRTFAAELSENELRDINIRLIFTIHYITLYHWR